MSQLQIRRASALALALFLGACGDDTPTTPTTTTQAAPTVTAVSPNSGSVDGGAAVTIAGTGFSAVQSVMFGDRAAVSYSVPFETTITATAPAGAAPGTTDVVVTTLGGSNATSEATWFTWLPNVLTDFTLSATSVKGGTPIRGAVSVALAAPAGGIRLPIVWSSTPTRSAAVTFPAAVFITQGETTGTFQIDSYYVSTDQQVSVSLEHWGVTKTLTFAVTP